MEKVLLVEDDQSLGKSLFDYLNMEGYDIDWAQDLKSAGENLKANKYSLIILDWMLPDGQGVDFLTSQRKEGNQVPVIMLTARTDLIDKVVGLESGANDYVTKPFEPRELLARVRVQLRDPREESSDTEEVIKVDQLEINKTTREVFFSGAKVEFTKMEFDFLMLLAEKPNRAFSREEILNKVWGYENYPTTRTVDTHVLQLRQKLRDNLIETVRGIGYKLTPA